MPEQEPQEYSARVWMRQKPINRSLLIRRSGRWNAGWWEPPGGTMNVGQEPDIAIDLDTKDAGVRETREETGIQLTRPQLVYMGTVIRVNSRDMLKQTDHYVAEVGKVAVQLTEGGHDMHSWLSRPSFMPYFGRENVPGGQVQLNTEKFDYLDEYVPRLAGLVGQEALWRPLAYYCLYYWPENTGLGLEQPQM